MLQNATPLRKSAPWPPNISDEHVSCIAPATRNASFQILFNATTSEPSEVVRACCAFNILTWKCAWRHNGAHFFDISTSKSAPNLVCLAHFDFEMCFAPQRHALFRHLNFQKWSEREVFSTFYGLTSKCASRHNSAQFFISHLARWLRTRRF